MDSTNIRTSISINEKSRADMKIEPEIGSDHFILIVKIKISPLKLNGTSKYAKQQETNSK